MRRKILSLAAVCMLGAALLPSVKQQTVSLSSTEEVPARNAQALFPELTNEDITDIRISAAEDCTFSFHVSEENGLSVNGRKADSGVFSTLVDQILSPSFLPAEAFSTDNLLLMSLTVYTDVQEFNARFYQDDDIGKYAYVLTDAENGRCLKTEAWRVGTLLLTCEGTRIFDASGQETPIE